MKHITVSRTAFAVRPATAEDRPYILSTWVRSATARLPHRGRSGAASRLAREAEAALEHHGAIVVCSPLRPLTIHAWAVTTREGELVYAYVPRDLRATGVHLGRAVVREALGGTYPERISVTQPWPWPSDRYVLTDALRVRRAA